MRLRQCWFFATEACAAVVLVQTSFMQHNGFEFFQRINILVGQKKFGDALKLAATFYQGQAKAVVGLPRKVVERKQVVKQQVSAYFFPCAFVKCVC